MKKMVFGIMLVLAISLAMPAFGSEVAYLKLTNKLFEFTAYETTDVVQQSVVAKKLLTAVTAKQGKRAVLDIVEVETSTDIQIPAKKVVKFKAGSELSKTVKLAICESGDRIFMSKQKGAATGETMHGPICFAFRLDMAKLKGWDLDGKGTDNVSEEIELAVDAIGKRRVAWEHKEQNTESEADWLDK